MTASRETEVIPVRGLALRGRKQDLCPITMKNLEEAVWAAVRARAEQKRPVWRLIADWRMSESDRIVMIDLMRGYLAGWKVDIITD